MSSTTVREFAEFWSPHFPIMKRYLFRHDRLGTDIRQPYSRSVSALFADCMKLWVVRKPECPECRQELPLPNFNAAVQQLTGANGRGSSTGTQLDVRPPTMAMSPPGTPDREPQLHGSSHGQQQEEGSAETTAAQRRAAARRERIQSTQAERMQFIQEGRWQPEAAAGAGTEPEPEPELQPQPEEQTGAGDSREGRQDRGSGGGDDGAAAAVAAAAATTLTNINPLIVSPPPSPSREGEADEGLVALDAVEAELQLEVEDL
jgi:hypothetical protein